nr:MAG TPA: cytokine interleukin [Caudoviricetes sp.]
MTGLLSCTNFSGNFRCCVAGRNSFYLLHPLFPSA